MKKTVLYERHVALDAKIVEFAGYLMPIEYSGLYNEHLVVRNTCGVFDVSHMGEILISGKDALAFTNYLLSNMIEKTPNRMTYAFLLNHQGGIIDDLMVYVYNDKKILLVVNASNLEKDYAWILDIKSKTKYNVKVEDISSNLGQLALQGPQAAMLLQKLSNYSLEQLKLFDFAEFEVNKALFLVSRSGYTGEDGFELYGKNEDILKLFDKLIDLNVIPCGLGCRDTLRFEAAMPLYGHEMAEDINPYEAGLGFAINLDKEDFIGKKPLLEIKKQGISRKVVALELLGRGIARAGYPVLKDDKEIGMITTGYLLPAHEKAYAFALLNKPYWEIGTEVLVQIRKNQVAAVVRNKKFLNKKYIK